MISRAKDKLTIGLIGLGGTIAMTQHPGRGLEATLGVTDLLASVPEVNALADIVPHDFLRLDSSDLRPAHWTCLAEWVAAQGSRYAGFVVTQGTDTLPHTASALALAFGSGLYRPIILTGAAAAG